ncbi:choice-of-anchor D domain-containing protein, partial [bacterium]|nr:choice-of-anchor D domain-containing protein [bacterium]
NLSRARLVFDSTAVGATLQKTLTISNTGQKDLSVTGITVSGTDASQFTVSPTSVTVPAGQAQEVVVTFIPTAGGIKSARLSAGHNAMGDPLSVSLWGIGAPPSPGQPPPQQTTPPPPVVTPPPQQTTTPPSAPVINVSAARLEFDSTRVGSTLQRALTISNTGSGGLSITKIAVEGPDASQFTVSLESASVAPAQAQEMTVTFAPTSGGVKSATLSIVHNAAGSPSVVALSGTGVSATSAPLTPMVGDGTGALAVGGDTARTLYRVRPGQRIEVRVLLSQEVAEATRFRVALRFDPGRLSATSGRGDGVFADAFFPTPPQVQDSTVTYTGGFIGRRVTAGGSLTTLTFEASGDFSGETEVALVELLVYTSGSSRAFAPQASVVLSSRDASSPEPPPPVSGQTPMVGDGTGALAVGGDTARTLGGVRPGQRIEVRVLLSQEVAGANRFQATLRFNPAKLSVVSGRGEGAFSGAFFPTPPQVQDSTVTYVGALMGQVATIRGALAALTFEALGDFAGETEVALTTLMVRGPEVVREFNPQASVVLSQEGGPSTDFDGDGRVDLGDFFAFAAAFGQKALDGDAKFDLDRDGEVGLADFFVFVGAFGNRRCREGRTWTAPGAS